MSRIALYQKFSQHAWAVDASDGDCGSRLLHSGTAVGHGFVQVEMW